MHNNPYTRTSTQKRALALAPLRRKRRLSALPTTEAHCTPCFFCSPLQKVPSHRWFFPQKPCRWHFDSIFIANQNDLDPTNIWTCSIIAMASVSMACHGPIRWAATRAPGRARLICRSRRMGLPPGFTSGLCRPTRPQTMFRPGCFPRTVIKLDW